MKEPTFLDFVGLYIGEGDKIRGSAGITNSDPDVISIGYYWLKKLAKNKIVLKVKIHNDNDVEEIRNFWSKLVNNEVEVRISYEKNDINKTGRISKLGTAHIGSNDTYLNQRITCWMDIRKKIYSNINNGT